MAYIEKPFFFRITLAVNYSRKINKSAKKRHKSTDQHQNYTIPISFLIINNKLTYRNINRDHRIET